MIDDIHANAVRRGLAARGEDGERSATRWYAVPRRVKLEMDPDVLPKVALS
jgi:hypothetical protein